jgi:hypothetical protein
MSDLRHTAFHRALHRPNLFLGGERELVMTTALLAGGLAIAAQNWVARRRQRRGVVRSDRDPADDGQSRSADEQGLSAAAALPGLLPGPITALPHGLKTAMHALKAYRDPAKGLPDLLDWAALIESGFVQGKNGSLMAGFFYRGHDIASSTEAERNYITGRVNAAFSRLGSGWVTWHDAVRLPAAAYPPPEASHFRMRSPA